MPDILVRDVPVAIKKEIERRAREHSRSLSAEIRSLIERGLTAEKSGAQAPGGLGSRLAALISREDWSEDLLPPRHESEDRPPPDFR